ncbi:MAG: hypothetical protein AAF485_20740 [Chloroflexota bacterium]
MERIQCAPCYDCGHAPKELAHFEAEKHEYHVFTVFGQDIVLCDFCDADFGSYYPDYFGLPGQYPKDWDGFGALQLVRKIYEPKCEPDFYCKQCDHRMAFIKFLKAARIFN